LHITSRADDTGRRCINILTQEEAEILLKALKESLVNFISIPDNGTNLDFKVKSNQPLEMFTINLYKGNIGKKYNIEARISKNNVRLLALHINATNKHYNPPELGGDLITGSHWHIYREGFNLAFAYPAKDIADKDFCENTLAFFREFNIIEVPKLSSQIDLLG
jgi:hypothetical protein